MPKLDYTDDEIEFIKSSSYRLQVYNDLRSQVSESLKQLSVQRETYLSIVVDLETRLAAAKHAERDAIEDRFVMESKLELALLELRRNEEQRTLNDDIDDRVSSGKFDDDFTSSIPESSTKYETLTIEFVKLQKTLDDTSAALSTKSSELFQSQNLAKSLNRELEETRGALHDKSNLLHQLDEVKRTLIEKESLLTQAERTISTLNFSLQELTEKFSSSSTELLEIQKNYAILQESDNKKNAEMIVLPQCESVSIQTDTVNVNEISTETDNDDDISQLTKKNEVLLELTSSLDENKKLRHDLEILNDELTRARLDIEKLKTVSVNESIQNDKNRGNVESEGEKSSVDSVSKFIQTLEVEDEKVIQREEEENVRKGYVKDTKCTQTEVDHEDGDEKCTQTEVFCVEDDTKCTQTENIHLDHDNSTQTEESNSVQTIIAAVQTETDLESHPLEIPVPPSVSVIASPPSLPSLLPPPPPPASIVAEPDVDEFFYSTPALPPSQPSASASIPRPVRSRSSSSSSSTSLSNSSSLSLSIITILPVTVGPSIQKEELMTPQKEDLIAPPETSQSTSIVSKPAPPLVQPVAMNSMRPLRSRATSGFTPLASEAPPLLRQQKVLTTSRQVIDDPATVDWITLQSSATPTKPVKVQSLSPPSAPNYSNLISDVNATATSLSAGINDATDVEPVSFFIESQVVDTSGTSDSNSTFLYRLSPSSPPKPPSSNQDQSVVNLSFGTEHPSAPPKTPLRDIVDSILSGYSSLSSISNDAWITLTQVTPSTSPATTSPEGKETQS